MANGWDWTLWPLIVPYRKTRRKDIRGLLEHMYDQIPGSREHVFAALGNVRQDYLLLQDPSKHHQEAHANHT